MKAAKAATIPILAAAIGFVGWSYLGGGFFNRTGADALPVYFSLPAFSLTERSGRQVSLSDLKGKVWVANFIYTHCPDTCPLQTAQMARLQKDFPNEKDLRLVSITVDPKRDTREVLKEYADRYGADPERWLFLTGPEEAIYELAQKGFRLSVADPDKLKEPGPASRTLPGGEPSERERFPGVVSGHASSVLGELLRAALSLFEPGAAWAHHPGELKLYIHSSRFALVDRKADIRGYYHYDEPKALEKLRRDIRTLLGNKP